MIRKMAKLPPALTKKGNAKNVEKAKAAYEQLGWTVTEEFIGSLSNPSYLIIEGSDELQHPKRPLIDKIEEPDIELSRKNVRLNQIQEQISSIGVIDLSLVNKEIQILPDLLTDDEDVLAVVAAIMDGAKWLIISTQQRVLMIDEGTFVRSRQKEVQLKNITSIEADIGTFNAEIEIMANASSLKIKKATPSDAKKFVTAVKAAMTKIQSGDPTPSNQAPENKDDLVSQLSRLSELKAAGAITDEEFTDAKSRILGKS